MEISTQQSQYWSGEKVQSTAWVEIKILKAAIGNGFPSQHDRTWQNVPGLNKRLTVIFESTVDSRSLISWVIGIGPQRDVPSDEFEDER